ncbi:MAG: DUF1269 domain-containing protein [Alphaproteobacteria bacterium]|nr:DUF1269 domain-containing protein [Alphaproteobacteria bacterium]
MAELVCIGFDDRAMADRLLAKMRELQNEHVVQIEDACIVERDGNGRVQLHQAVNMVGLGAAGGGLSGAFWGSLIGLLFLNPLVGALVGSGVGAGAGALSGAVTDYGINDDFIRSVGNTIRPGSAAIFLLLRHMSADKMIPELTRFGGRVVRTTMSNQDEQRLRDALAGITSPPEPATVGHDRPKGNTA